MTLSIKKICDSLKDVRWHVAAATYGSNHATLIGLLVDWWISLDTERHGALDGGPSHGCHKKGMCDALFLNTDNPDTHMKPIGLLEVEGSYGQETADKIGRFFKPGYQDLNSLEFAILLLYEGMPITNKEDGKKEKDFIFPKEKETIKRVQEVSANNPEKSIIVMILEKAYRKQKEGIRSRSEYYFGEMEKVEGYLYKNGKEKHLGVLWKK